MDELGRRSVKGRFGVSFTCSQWNSFEQIPFTCWMQGLVISTVGGKS